jgi:hypothetical protein
LLFGVSDPQAASIFGYSTLVDADASHDPGGHAHVLDQSHPAGDPVSLAVGDSIGAAVSADVRAVGPLGLSTAFIHSAAVLSAANLSSLPLELTFLFAFDLLSQVSVTDIAAEFSVAFSQVVASSLDGSVLTTLFSASTEADSDFGPLFDTLDESALPDVFFPFSLTLAPEEELTLVLSAFAEVEAASLASVPLPLSSLLFSSSRRSPCCR